MDMSELKTSKVDKELKKYFGLCNRMNTYIYVFNDIWIYTSMVEEDIISYRRTDKHRPIHKVQFKNTEFLELFFTIFPALKGKNFVFTLKEFTAIFNKRDNILDAGVTIKNGMIQFDSVRTIIDPKGKKKEYKLAAKETTEKVILRDIVVGKECSTEVLTVIDGVLKANNQKPSILVRMTVDQFVYSSTEYFTFQSGELGEINNKLSSEIHIPIWDGESSISIARYAKQLKDPDKDITAKIIMERAAIKMFIYFTSNVIDVISINDRLWFPFTVR
ncbi:MAG: hypothetical protein GY804_08590 [Alphaproteobacteria bacterium]|nr:hypothetical protein [Alphaproteobacteria bacterium]